MSERLDFQGFSKIPRLSRDMIITEKIDGTNAQICITEDGKIYAGSRKRWITPSDDNFGFAAWVEEHKDELIEGLGPGRHYGEWWGKSIQRNYGLDERQFSLFNVQRWHKPETLYQGWECFFPRCLVPPKCCNVVPILSHSIFSTEQIYIQFEAFRHMGSYAASGFMDPEGIVICHVPSGYLFKKTFENDDGGKNA